MAHIQPAETETVKIFMYIFMGCEMENDTPGNKYPKMKKVSNKTSKSLRSHVAPSSLPPRGTREKTVSYLQPGNVGSTQKVIQTVMTRPFTA